jgi:Tfp pilus assembly protein PilV
MMIVALIALLSVALAVLALVGYGIDAYLFAVAAQRERASRPRSAIQLERRTAKHNAAGRSRAGSRPLPIG